MSHSGTLPGPAAATDAPAVRVFRALLRLYPRAFRRRYGDGLVRAFLAERRSGRRRGVGFWAWIVRDAVASGVAERLGRGRRPSHLPPPHAPRAEMLRDLLHDIRYAARALLASPTFSVVAILILTLGIGANAVVFTLVNTLLFTEAPGLRDARELVRVTRTNNVTRSSSWGYPDYEYVRDHARAVEDIAAFEGRTAAATFSTEADGDPLSVDVHMVTANYFDVLGVGMAHGRGFGPEQAVVDGDAMALVAGYGFWRTALGADPTVVGRTVYVNGHAFRVLGVAAEGFRGIGPMDSAPDFWAPATAQPVLRADGYDAWLRRVPHQRIAWLSCVARLAPGATLEQARADMDRVNDELHEQFPDDNREGFGIGVWDSLGLSPSTRDQIVQLARLLGAVVFLVLLIVCANIAVLQLARASHRQREVGIRFALGAGRGRVVRQLLTESLLLAGIGALGGFALAFGGARVVGAWLPFDVAVAFRPDLRALLFSVGVAVLVALAFGLAPALISTRGGVIPVLQSRAVAGGRERLRTALVATQVAVSMVLVLGAALFVRSLLTAEAVDPGFATESRVFASVFTGNLGYSRDEQNALLDDALRRLQARPEVEHASVTVMIPFQGTWSSDFDATGSDDENAPRTTVLMNAVGPGYFETMGIPVLAGRPFEEGDREDGGVAVVVNEAFAEELWPDANPVGQTLALQSDDPVDRVVGVVANTNYQSLGEDPQPVAYASIYQLPMPRLVFVASTTGDVVALSRVVQEEILAVDRNLPIASVQTIEEAIETQIGTYRLGARAMGTFGLLAALLAAVGLYGVLSYVVAAGTREIGIRMALGASEAGVLRRVVARGLRVAGIGVVIGLAAAFLTARLIAGMLYRIQPYDPVSFIAVPLLLLAVAGIASVLPARRASGVDPVEALRIE